MPDRGRVVIYDDAGGSIASRLWFLMELYGHPGQARVLDGGLAAFVAAGGKLETAVPQVTPGDYTLRVSAAADDGVAFLNTAKLQGRAPQVLGEIQFKHTLSADVQVTILAVRPDQRVVCRQEWQEAKARVTGVRKLLQNLASLAA